MKRLKKSLRVVISMFLVLVMLGGSCVFADEDSDSVTVITLSETDLKQKIIDLMEKYPEADLDVDTFLCAANQTNSLNAKEMEEYIKTIVSKGPSQEYSLETEKGKSTLLIYANQYAAEYGFEYGEELIGNDAVYWDGTYVYAQSIWGFTNLSLSYYVNHNVNNYSYVGSVTSAYGLNSTQHSGGLYVYYFNSRYFTSTSGSIAQARGNLHVFYIQDEGVSIPQAVIWLTFNVSSLSVSYSESSIY